MKRAHRRLHFAIWAILGPTLFGILLLAILNRPGEPVNDQLPEALTEEAR